MFILPVAHYEHYQRQQDDPDDAAHHEHRRPPAVIRDQWSGYQWNDRSAETRAGKRDAKRKSAVHIEPSAYEYDNWCDANETKGCSRQKSSSVNRLSRVGLRVEHQS